VALDIAVDGPTDGGLHGALEEDLVHLLSGPGMAALMVLRLKRGGDGCLHRPCPSIAYVVMRRRGNFPVGEFMNQQRRGAGSERAGRRGGTHLQRCCTDETPRLPPPREPLLSLLKSDLLPRCY
jgi:hypothetical protein